jgi:hypothetical protein
MMFKVLVCGSRFYEDQPEVNRVLDIIASKKGKHNVLIITGGAIGADEFARKWAVSRKVNHLVMYAPWEVMDKGAGPWRNRKMLKKKPHLVVAFRVNKPGENRGTDDMCDIAENAGIKVKRFD